MTYYTKIFIGLISITGLIIAQGVGFPDAPNQAPIGGLELLIGSGGAMAWKRLRKTHHN